MGNDFVKVLDEVTAEVKDIIEQEDLEALNNMNFKLSLASNEIGDIVGT